MTGDKKIYFPAFYLTKDGKALSEIRIPKKAVPAVLEAARDLQTHIEKISGALLPIAEEDIPVNAEFEVHVGYTAEAARLGLPAPEEKGERVILAYDERTENKLFLYGNEGINANGTAFAVTMLLEKLGCGWFGPEELWQVIPENPTLKIDYLSKDERPRFTSRYSWVLNTTPEIGRRWYLGGEKKEIEHAFWLLFPREKYLESHPEWYALVNGKRDPYSVEWWQMCYSNEELQKATAQKIREFFRSHPDYSQATLSANDGWFEGFCECEACRKLGTPSEVMLQFVNRIAEMIEEEFPDKKLMFFVYFPTLDPPNKPMKAHRNVIPMFCKESCMCHSVDNGPDCGYHVRHHYDFGHVTYPRPWKQNVQLWKERTDCKQICVWEWNCCAAANPVWKDIPWVQGELMGRNMRCFEELGAEYVYIDQGPVASYHDTEASYPLRWPLWYLSAKSCWSGNETPTQLLLSACKKLFGPAADLMAAYYTCLADLNGLCDEKAIAWHMPEPEEVYPPESFARVDNILAAALASKPLLSEKEAMRLENQKILWEKAKEVILESRAKKETN